jgi:hypothetical protein
MSWEGRFGFPQSLVNIAHIGKVKRRRIGREITPARINLGCSASENKSIIAGTFIG